MRDRMREQRDNDQGNNQPQGRPEGMTRSGFSGMSMRISPEIQEILTDEQLEKYKLYISEQNIERRINMYDRRLELTDDQKDGIRKILVDVQEQISKLTPSENMSRSERRKLNSTMNDIREESNEAIKKLLKGDQVTAFEEMQERMNSRRRGRR